MSTATPPRTPRKAVAAGGGPRAGGRRDGGPFGPEQLLRTLRAAVRKLDPRVMVTSPVMFVVLVGSVVTTGLALADPTDWFGWAVAAWLWLTTLFANLAEAVAEGRGEAEALRGARTDVVARRLAGVGARNASPAPNCAWATWSSARPGTSCPATGTWSRAWPRSTSPRSPGSRPR
ncbi:hypothetical protein ACW23B_22870 [Streptomyces albidoflavus]